MIITYPSEHKWHEPVHEAPDSKLGKNNRSRLRSTVSKLPETSITYTVELLTDDILEWFTPLYNETIASKNNAKLYDIQSTTIGKQTEYKYYALVVSEDGTPIGATIFSERKTIISIAYRIYPHNWGKHKLQAQPAIFSEYLLNEYAWEKGYKKISHGKDRNPYGLNSHIGLAMFKLSVGCKAYLPTTPFETKTLDLNDIDTDILILQQPEDGQEITNAILYVEEGTKDKYSQLTKYEERLKVEVIIRPT